MSQVRTKEPAWQLALASVGWAVLTFTLVILLGVGLPILLFGLLLPSFPGSGFLIASLVSVAVLIVAITILGRQTQRRVSERPHLRRALMSGYGFALLISIPMMVIWFGYWVISSSVWDPTLGR
jgi:hypothetical protein